MRIKNIGKLKILIPMLALGIFFGACDEDEPQSSEVVLLSFGPTGIMHGDTAIFIGENLTKVDTIEFAEEVFVLKESFLSQSDARIELQVPASAESGQVVLHSPEGDVSSKSIISFEVFPTVSGMTSEARHDGLVTFQGDYLNWVTEVVFYSDLSVTEFESQSQTELVVEVPNQAETGIVKLIGGGTISHSLEPGSLTILLPKETELSPLPLAPGEELTITGTDLDLVASLSFPSVVNPVTSFVSQSSTEIKVMVPENATSGSMDMVTIYDLTVEMTIELELSISLEPLSYVIYNDAFENSWQNSSWGGAVDAAFTDVILDGSNSIKKTYDGSWDALRFVNGSVDITAYSNFVVYVYGAAGDEILQLVVNEQWGMPYAFTVPLGVWTEVVIPVADVNGGASDPWTQIVIQGQGTTADVYFDFVGFR